MSVLVYDVGCVASCIHSFLFCYEVLWLLLLVISVYLRLLKPHVTA